MKSNHLKYIAIKKSCTRALRSMVAASFLLLVLMAVGPRSWSQEIALGTWRLHASYNSVINVVASGSHVYAASMNGILMLDKDEQSITTFSRLSGLSATDITSIAFDEQTQQLIVTYANGFIDVIKDNVVTTVDPFKASSLTGSRKINHISIHNGLAYLAADFGVMVFDLNRTEVKETWRDLGPTGDKLKIFATTWLGDSIYLASEKGVLAGKFSDNLLDFQNYKRSTPDASKPAVQFITTFRGKVSAAATSSGLYHYENGLWKKDAFLVGSIFKALQPSAEKLFIVADQKLWQVTGGGLSQIIDERLPSPNTVIESDGKLWIGDNLNGLVSNVNGVFESFLPNGPSQPLAFRLKTIGGRIERMSGGFSSTLQPLANTGNVDLFQNGTWTSKSLPVPDITDAFQKSDDQFSASFGYGLLKMSPDGATKVYDNTNSPLQNANVQPKSTYITSLAESPDGLWVANYGAVQSLHLLSANETWLSFTPQTGAARFPLKIVVDAANYLWTVINPEQGGGLYVFDRAKNASAYLSETTGGGALPSRNVRSIAIDREGFVWVGTDKGVAYFFSPANDAIKPIFKSRFLLQDDKVTALAVDGGNRKWMGTERGVWLFDPTGEKLIYNFTAENSPLLSNAIQDIAINPVSGEVFFATDKGIVSFRSDATESTSVFESVRVFPNPVTNSFQGSVAITGLATDAIVKITDINGSLVWQTQSNGGTASWMVNNVKGQRAPTGIYLVFAAAPDGVESIVGKIAVVD